MGIGGSSEVLRRAARAVAGINERIAAGRAVVATLDELRGGGTAGGGPRDIDVITLAFSAGFAGTAAMLCVPVAGRGVFTRAERIALNGIAGMPGPAPNERLGVVDALIFAEHRAGETRGYSGAALMLDLLHGKQVRVECVSVEGTRHERNVDLTQLEFARLYAYNVAVPSVRATRAGFLGAIGRGTRVLLNGADGIVIGCGSRDFADTPGLSLAADLKGMDSSLVFVGDDGTPQHTVALAIPVLDASMPAVLADWAQSTGQRDAPSRSTLAASAQLAARIRENRFLLTGSDLPL
ncbi:MAG: hypothetical protein HY017_20785 [Betaproteobacteria bacterium]|nr:hypothetical protein [Betaproteobacteria bacterium]